MIISTKKGTPKEELEKIVDKFEKQGLDVTLITGKDYNVFGLVGDTSRVDIDLLKSLEMVETVKRVSEPFKQANRKFHPKDTIIEVGNARIGGGYFAVIAGPCSVESEEQIIAVASAVKESGASILRGGAFKPRTSPYAFQGLKADGIVSGGMIPKLDNAFACVEKGVSSVVITRADQIVDRTAGTHIRL